MATTTIAPQTECERWLRAALVADGDVTDGVSERVYRAVAPRDAAPPYVVYQFVSGRPVRVYNQIVWYQEDFQVMSVGTRSTLALEPIEQAVSAVLEAARGETAKATIIDCRKIADYELTTIEEGDRYERLGGLWRILVKPKPA